MRVKMQSYPYSAKMSHNGRKIGRHFEPLLICQV